LIGIVPCAGYGSRLASFTDDVPKPLIRIGGKPLIEHPLALMKTLDLSLVVLVISSHTRDVQAYLGSNYQGLAIEYVEQEPPRGLLDAVYRARGFVADKFITVLSDEIYVGCRHRDLVEYWHTHPEVEGLVGYLVSPSWDDIRKNYSMVMTDGRVEELEEKPKRQVNAYLGTGTWGLKSAFFDYAAFALTENPPERRSFVDALQLMIHDNYLIQGYDLMGSYVNVNAPADLERAELLVRRPRVHPGDTP
jgi:dTDP-glucose pyrophosphorylase